MVKAIGKVLGIQNDLFARWHVKDGDDLKDPVLTPNSEREGFMHGRMMVNLDESLESGAEESLSSPAQSDIGTPAEELRQCPFTGMAKQMESLNLRSPDTP
jgi:hypothetical protein